MSILTQSPQHPLARSDAALLEVISRIHSFEQSYRELGKIRSMYNGARIRFMDSKTRQKFKEAKRTIRGFNDALRLYIEKNGAHMTFNELVDFLTAKYISAHGESPYGFANHLRDTLVGARNEVAFEQILAAAGITFDKGTDNDDARGGDVLVDDVRIDTKTSWQKTERAKAEALAYGYNADRIVWSHVESEDYEGQLTLPLAKLRELAKKVRPDIEQAVASAHPGRRVT